MRRSPPPSKNPRSTRERARSAPALLVALIAGVVAGCSGGLAPNGLDRAHDALRRDLAAGEVNAARSRFVSDAGPTVDDPLLAVLHRGLLDHYAARYDQSTAALDTAVMLARDRYTRRVSRGALSLISSDRALQYSPNRTERLLIHYYAALGHLHRGDPEAAAVEARRLTQQLRRFSDDGWDCEGGRLCSVLRHMAGAVFERAGEENDAAVAYRNARSLGREAVGTGAAGAANPDTLGEVVVLVEQGFVAHRVEDAAAVLLFPGEAAAIRQASGPARDRITRAIARRILAERRVGPVPDRPRRTRPRRIGRRPADEDCDESDDTDDGTEAEEDCDAEDPHTPYLLKIAWPVHRDDYTPVTGAAVALPGGEGRVPLAATADVSGAVMGEFEDDRLRVLARAVARAATKFALTRTLEDQVSRAEEGIGRLVAILANLGGVLLENADTRSWHLLPDAIGIARLRLPPGRHTLTVERPPRGGRAREQIRLDPIEVRAGEVRIVSTRFWR